MDKRETRSRALLLISLATGFVLGAISLSPVSANHTPQHTNKQIKKLKNQLNGLKATVGSLQTNLTAAQGTLTSVQGTVNNLNSLQHVSGSAIVADGSFGQVEAVCPAGTFATGGGGVTDSFDGLWIDSYPSHGVGFPGGVAPQGRTAWALEWGDFGTDGFPSTIRAYAVCSKVASASGNYLPGSVPFRSEAGRRAWNR